MSGNSSGESFAHEEAARTGSASITVCPNGPLLVRGPVQLRDADGGSVENDRNVIALCRCGRSSLKPLCDGSHRQARFRDTSTAESMGETLRTARPARSARPNRSASTEKP